MLTIILPSLIFLAVLFFARSIPKAQLNNAFVKLGDMRGKSKEDIIAAVGQPKGISNHDDGSKTLAWHAGGYHMVLLFDKDDKMVKIQNEIH